MSSIEICNAICNEELKLVANYICNMSGELRRGERPVQRSLRSLAMKDDSIEGRIKSFVSKTIQRARRVNVWWRFDRVGKKFLELLTRLPVTFRSKLLLRCLLKTLKELLSLINTQFRYYVIGYRLARKICEAAHSWGNRDALEWIRDRNFIIYWGMMAASNPLNV